MGMITGIRAALPVAEAPAAAPAEPPQKGAVDATAPVAAPVVERALREAGARSATSDPQLMEARMTTEVSAAAAAEAARLAYIRASIVAGLNPLPLG